MRLKKTKVWKDEILDSRRRFLTHLFCSRRVSYSLLSYNIIIPRQIHFTADKACKNVYGKNEKKT